MSLRVLRLIAPRQPSWRSRLLAALLTLLTLAASACGAGGTAATTPTLTHTPTPITRAHSALYAFVTNQGPTGPNSTDIYALGLGDGKQVWHTQVSGGGSGAALGGGALYLGTVQPGGPTSPPTGTLQAFSASTGTPLWHVSPPSGEDVPVVANGDAVFAFAISFASSQIAPSVALTALGASDGTSLWSADLGPAPGGIQSALVLGNGALYLVTTTPPSSGITGPGQAVAIAVDSATGKTLWHVPLPGLLNAGPVLGNGALYLAVQNPTQGGTSAVMAIRASDGKSLWSKAPPTAATVGAIVASGQTVCYSYGLLYGPGSGLVALHAADGSASWQTDIQGGGPVPIAADTGAVYALESTKSAAPTLATTLNVFDASTGRVLLTKAFPNLPIQANFQAGTPLQVTNGVLYVVSSGIARPASTATQQPGYASIVLALHTHDGSAVWQQQFNGSAEPAFLISP